MTAIVEKNITPQRHRLSGRAGCFFSEKPQVTSQSGFTLIELLFVALLVALLAGALVAGLDRDDQNEAKLNSYSMAEMARALHQFKQDVGHYPDEDDSSMQPQHRLQLLLSCDVAKDAGCTAFDIDTRRGWHGPYLVDKGGEEDLPSNPGLFVFKDVWGSPLQLHLDHGKPRIFSLGADKTTGGVPSTCAASSDDVVLCL